MGKKTTRKIRRRIFLFPSDDIQYFKIQLLQDLPNGEDIVVGATYPNGSIVFHFISY